MTARTIVEGTRKSIGTDLTTTNPTAVLTASAETNYAVLGISFANTDTLNSCDFKMEWNDGTTDFVLVEAVTVAASEAFYYDFPIFLLRGTGSVKVTAQNANDLHVVVSYVETQGRNM
jgi:hypothetical protein